MNSTSATDPGAPPGTVLLTGASGLLGANVALQLKDSGCGVVAVSNRFPVRSEGIRGEQADLSARDAAVNLVGDVRPGWVIHCAALTNLDLCEQDPEQADRINVAMSRYLAEGAREVGARLLYISTDSIFDGARGGYDEEAPPAPLNHYARSKLEGEAAVREVLGDRALIVRVNIYGWNAQSKLSLAEWMLTNLEAGKRFPGFQDVVFNALLVNDLGDLMLRMMGRSLGGLYHLGCAEPCSKFEFGRRLAEVFGLDAGLVEPSSSDQVAFRAARPKNTTLHAERASRALGCAMPGLLDGLRRFRDLRDHGWVSRLKNLL